MACSIFETATARYNWRIKDSGIPLVDDESLCSCNTYEVPFAMALSIWAF